MCYELRTIQFIMTHQGGTLKSFNVLPNKSRHNTHILTPPPVTQKRRFFNFFKQGQNLGTSTATRLMFQ
jgi:hypothetical protein